MIDYKARVFRVNMMTEVKSSIQRKSEQKKTHICNIPIKSQILLSSTCIQ